MTNDKRQQALSSALEIIDTLDSLYTATVLLIAAKTEIEKLVELEPSDPRRVCDRAGYLLDLFHERELIPAMNTIRDLAEPLTRCKLESRKRVSPEPPCTRREDERCLHVGTGTKLHPNSVKDQSLSQGI
jgi:hypothetical protein